MTEKQSQDEGYSLSVEHRGGTIIQDSETKPGRPGALTNCQPQMVGQVMIGKQNEGERALTSCGAQQEGWVRSSKERERARGSRPVKHRQMDKSGQ